jgi:hypothetical protein
MPTVGFEPTIAADERPKTYALDSAATVTGFLRTYYTNILFAKYCSVFLLLSVAFLRHL